VECNTHFTLHLVCTLQLHTHIHTYICTYTYTHAHTHTHNTRVHTHVHTIFSYGPEHFHAAVNTNNGTETLNKLLKYNFLPRKKAMTLSAIATLLVESFLPDTYQKYLFLNYKQSTQYRSYRSIVPDYLHGKPRSVIIHCLERRSVS